MELKLIQEDPLKILKTTKQVVENAQHVFINLEKLEETAKKIVNRFSQGLSSEDMGYTVTENLDNDVQLIFIEDVVNFCFWASKDKPKWQVELPDGSATEGGWFGLQTCFERGIKEGVPILDPTYLSTISLDNARHFFRGINGVEIPLLQERVHNLQEAGLILIEKFDGKFTNVLEKANYDAIELGQIIIDNFSSYRDISILNGQEVYILKRAQICANDLTYVLAKKKKKITSLDKLTAFADYKLPQILRLFEVFEYTSELADKVDNYIEIPHDSREEIEIRAATIWAVELIRQRIPELTAGDIDNTIWLLSQSLQDQAKPYHRTRTIFY